ncbi:MAG TPA: class II fructose-bisphosphatase [Ktedonobacteraceae bacterium]
MTETRFEESGTRERNLAMELVRVTEAAALSAGRWMGKGDKEKVDQAAVDAMRQALDGVDMNGVVVIGEGEKDEAPMLYVGEQIGNGLPPDVDVAVDPVDGTRLLALGLPGALAVVATAERGSMYSAPPGVYYMEKIAVGPAARGAIDINDPVAENLQRIAEARSARIDDVTVVILDRPRHKDIIRQIREAGARIRLISDGDVSAAIQAAMEDFTGVDVLMGIGGAPEAVLAAAALKCVGGEIQCKIWPLTEKDRGNTSPGALEHALNAERERLRSNGIDPDQVFHTNDLVRGNDVSFAATGITSGELVGGVEYYGWGARTSSVMMRSRSGTVRYIQARHKWRKGPDSLGKKRID